MRRVYACVVLGLVGLVPVWAQTRSEPGAALAEAAGVLRINPADATSTLCWTESAPTGAAPTETCVPLAVLQVTFLGWKPGDPLPARTIIDLQRQWAGALQQWRTCEGELAPLAASQHVAALNSQQQALDVAMARHAPAGLRWDPVAQAYVPSPPVEKKSGG